MASHSFPVAVIGMAVKLPGAKDCSEFWDLMINRGDTISDVPDKRKDDIGILRENEGEGIPFLNGSFFKSVDTFDADLFQIDPKEALNIEPEQRMFIETVWEAIEDAAYASRIRDTYTGVYVGNKVNTYKYTLTEKHPGSAQGSHSPCISSRISSMFNLTGPAMMVPPECSSSLLAVHLACQGLLSGDCEMAIAGGITLDLLPISTKTENGEGDGVVILKLFDKAVSDGDNIYGILEATTAKQAVTTSRPGTQATMLNQTLSYVNISPASVSNIEVCGSRTDFRDPIQITGITNAFDRATANDVLQTKKIPVGSVKTIECNLADGTAGVVSLIQVLLCLKNNSILPAVTFTNPNPNIDWEKEPVYVNKELKELPKYTDGSPRYLDVSAFDLFGKNVQMMVKKYLPQPTHIDAEAVSKSQMLCLSAISHFSLKKNIEKIRTFLVQNKDMGVAYFSSLCYTLNVGREQKRCKARAIAISDGCKTMIEVLSELLAKLDDSQVTMFEKTLMLSSNICISEKQRQVIEEFENDSMVNWEKYYQDCPKEEKQIIGQLPTYAFMKTQCWSLFSNPTNIDILKFKHQLTSHDKTNVIVSAQHEPFVAKQQCSEDRLASLLADVLGLDVHCLSEKDMRKIGEDSRMFTKMKMKVHDVFGVHIFIKEFQSASTLKEMSMALQEKIEIKHRFNQIVCKQEKNTSVRSSLIGVEYASTLPSTALNRKDVAIPTGLFKLSAAQKRMFVLQTTIPESTAYTETILISTNQQVNHEYMYLFRLLGKKHPSLTAKINGNGTFMTLSNEINCVSKCDDFLDSLTMIKHIKETIPIFKLGGGPLSQMRMVTVGEQSILIIHVNQIIADEVTIKRIKTSARKILEVENEDSESWLNDYCYESYEEYIESETYYLQSQESNNDMLFWQTIFDTIPEIASFSVLPSLETAKIIASRAITVNTQLTTELMSEIQLFSKSLGITEFHYALACLCLVLMRYLGTDDILISVPVSTRGTKFLNTDGLFVNIVLFRYKMNSSHTFGQHIIAVFKSWMKAMVHAKYPLDKVNQMIWEKFGVDERSLCSTMFNFATVQDKSDAYKINPRHAKMPISFDIVPSASGYSIICEYSENLIDDGIVTRLNESLVVVLSNTFRWSNAKITEREILSESETRLITSVSNSTTNIGSGEIPVHMMFAKHATLYPNKEAIYCDGRSVTYRELHSISEKVAAELKTIEGRSSRPVLLYMEKSILAIAAMFGVWLIGGHFQPVSLHHSVCLEILVKEINPCAVLIDKPISQETIGTFTAVLDVGNIALRDNSEYKVITEGNGVSLDDIAYVMQTSGSTGKPKRIKISHRNLSVVASAWTHVYDMSSYNVNILQWAQITFDVCIGDVIRGLCCVAGAICLCPNDKRLDTEYIAKLVEEKRITFAEVTPQFGLLIVEHANELNSIKCLVLGSDILQKEVYCKIKIKLAKGQRLFNSYGMTEATIDSACFENDELPVTRQGSVPVGRPLPGVALHVLDPTHLLPCPIGTIGELYIGGNVLGIGDTHLIQHELGTLLKTNDRACWLPSGNLEILGRLDNIRKLRGFRINTVEIENTILKNASNVVDVHVSVLGENGDTKHNQFLCAFVVLRETDKFDENEIRHVVRQSHPYFMIPDIVSCMNVIPLTSNGKVDTKAFPSIQTLLQRNPRAEFELSETASQLRLLFAEALGLDDETSIDVEQTFMEHGGNSHILVRFHSLLTHKTNIDIKISDIFSYPSISSLAEYVEIKSSAK